MRDPEETVWGGRPGSSVDEATDFDFEAIPATSHRGARLLIVDDEAYIRDILRRWLQAEGYECEVASSGEEGWQKLQTLPFELVICDIMMPGMSGIELLGMVQQKLPDVAVIMVTAVDDRTMAVRALEEGAYGFVIKPFESNEIIINVVNALERRRLSMVSGQYERRLEEKVHEQTTEIRQSRDEIALRLMAAQQYRHDETGAHIRRIGLGAEAIGKKMGYNSEELDMLRLAGPMHDVGKIGIPDAILNKPGKLTSQEWEIMKTHTLIGAQVLGDSSIPLLQVAREVALYHHERWDGDGYPERRAGIDIPESARIVALLDVYDALVHDRVYRPAMPEDKALKIMKEGRAKQFDPALYDAFMDVLPELRRVASRVPDTELI